MYSDILIWSGHWPAVINRPLRPGRRLVHILRISPVVWPDKWWRVAALAVLLAISRAGTAVAAPAAIPAGAAYISSARAGQVIVNGTSTLHAWSIQSSALKGRAVLVLPTKSRTGAAPPAAARKGPSAAIRSIHLAIPVASLKSSEGGGMDSTVYHSLKQRRHPIIIYRLTSATLRARPSRRDPEYHFAAIGRLTVAGVTRPLKLELSVLPRPHGRLRVSTVVRMKMTDFGIAPPTAMFGIIRSGNVITVKATWRLTRRISASGPRK